VLDVNLKAKLNVNDLDVKSYYESRRRHPRRGHRDQPFPDRGPLQLGLLNVLKAPVTSLA
jgi:hypothetical protein